MSTKTFPYTTNQLVEVEVYDPKLQRSEWRYGNVQGMIQRDDKDYGVDIILFDGRHVSSPYGAAPECVRPAY